MITSEVKFEVSVCCMTYNQKDYIEDTLRGFTMQQTSFPYICMVLDDASTDGEPELLRHFMDKNFDLTEQGGAKREETDNYNAVLCRHKDNQNCYFAVYWLKYNHYQQGKNLQKMEYYSALMKSIKYTGFCEGDDFWISPDFLQTAVDFLEENEDFSAVFGNKLVSNEKGEIFNKIEFKGGLTVHDIMRGRNMGIRNLIFRKECLYVEPFEDSFRDIHVYYKCAVCGKLKYFNQDFSVYRLTGKGVYSSLHEKEVIYTSYLHYYEFHKKTAFKYQKDCVNYQIRKLMGNMNNLSDFRYCCKLIWQFHVPSKMRFWWYIQYGTLMGIAHLRGLLRSNKKKVCINL